MKFYLQMGHGMMTPVKEIIQFLPRPTSVILSPRDLTTQQMKNFVPKIQGSEILLDPQLYAPNCTHHKLTSQSYWINDFQTVQFLSRQRSLQSTLLEPLAELNHEIGSNAIILPGKMASAITPPWLDFHEQVINSADCVDLKKYATICLSSDVIKDRDQIIALLTRAESWEVNGYYIILQHPNNEYLVQDPIWLLNMLELVFFLKMQGKEVILGYSNQQMLIASCANVDGIASGTYMNVRSFDIKKFDVRDPDDVKKKRTWYYSPTSLSEYTLEYLDIAMRNGILNMFAPPNGMNTIYSSPLFGGAFPSTVNYSESSAFKHYLICMSRQCELSSKESFDESYQYMTDILDQAQRACDFAENYGVRGRNRDFGNCVDACISALVSFKETHGLLLNKCWNK